MATVNVPFSKLAEVALATMARASISADDETIAMVQGSRNMLRAIAQGQLVLGEPAPAKDQAPELPKAVRRRAQYSGGVAPAAQPIKGSGINGGEGVIGEDVTGAPQI